MPFKPSPFFISKDRKGNIKIDSTPIEWDKLSPEEFKKQWNSCMNSIWFYENEGVFTREHLSSYLFSYLQTNKYTPEEIKLIKSAPDWQIPTTLLSICFLLAQGINNPESDAWAKHKIKLILETAQNRKEEPKLDDAPEKPKRSIQEAMAEQLSNLLGEIQGLEDRMLQDKHDMFAWLKNNNVPKVHIDPMINYFKPRLDELIELRDTNDEQLKEGYSHLKKSELKRMIEWYEKLLSDLDAYKRLKQATRKIRVSKPKSPAKIVSKMKYLRAYPELSLKSVPAEKIVGSTQVWFFNVKTRKIICYNASDMDKELTVKGSTLLGWDPKSSVSKTLRKPDSQLLEFMGGGKVANRNFLKNIKAKESLLNGRINKDMVILKVY